MSAQPKTLMRPPVMTMATNMSHVVEFADAIPFLAIVSTLSAKSSRHMVQLPVENRLGSGASALTSNKIKVMTMHASKGLEFPVVALPGVGHMPAPSEDEKEAARVFYVAATRATRATRATQRLVMGVCGKGFLSKRMGFSAAPTGAQNKF